ncbi:aminotransferase class IV [Membranihabitans maritimus]|uniref:aminotransferase class IV n=1 Tax=Membranihabitans maritimus TaxID=2904244 RepID=UPI001F02EBEC|nr:aminotransferase class IV [Membranihabitans maritimus]
MSRFLESICINKKIAENLPLHQARMNRTIRDHYGPNATTPNLREVIKANYLDPDVRYKCRILYDREISQIEFHPYVAKSIDTLECVINNTIDYSYKLTDRKVLNNLKATSGADEIIIIKNGLITDSRYSNLAFLKDGSWYTPSTPLLKGTKRQKLIKEGMLHETLLKKEDLNSFEKVKLVNAMLDWGKAPSIPIKNIKI